MGIALIGVPLYLAYVASISGRKKRRRRKRMSDGEESDYWFDHEEYQNRQNGNAMAICLTISGFLQLELSLHIRKLSSCFG